MANPVVVAPPFFDPVAEKRVSHRDLDRGLKRFGGLAVPGWEAANARAEAEGWTPPRASPGYYYCDVCKVATAWVAPDGRVVHPYCEWGEAKA